MGFFCFLGVFFFALDFIFNWDLIKGNFFFFLLKWGGLLVDWGVWLVGWFGVNNLGGVFREGCGVYFGGFSFFFSLTIEYQVMFGSFLLALIIEGHASQNQLFVH